MKTFPFVEIVVFLLAIALMIPAAQQVSPMYPVSIERLDFLATEGQTAFQTNVLARTNFVEVFENGLLQTAPGDYTSANIPGHTVITFASPLSAGQKVSLIYWR